MQDFAARPRFAPVIFLSGEGEEEAREALKLGAHAVLGRAKIDHDKLVDALASASSKQVQARADWRTSAEAQEAQKFGEAFIRGYRRVRRLAGGPVSELYLAESEQAGALVVLKVARDQQTENELDHSFKRFLQEYEIVQRIRHTGVVRLYDLGVSDAACVSRHGIFRCRGSAAADALAADATRSAADHVVHCSCARWCSQRWGAASGSEARQRDAAG